jgi:hypothetical protein
MKQQGRLFTFGCSMTKYRWPTWADIVGEQWEHYQNWAKPGAGNNFIFNSIVECDKRNNFTSDDLVLIMWSGVARIDYYQQNSWCHQVNQFAKNQTDFPYSCPDGYEIISYPLFSAIDQYLCSKNLRYKMFSFMPYDTESKAGILYKDILTKIKTVQFNIEPKKIKQFEIDSEVRLLYDRLHGKDWPPLDQILEKRYNVKNNEIKLEIEEFIRIIETDRHYKLTSKDVTDFHPSPLDHLQAIGQIDSDLAISENTTLWLEDINAKILTGQRYQFQQKNIPHRL